MSARGHRMAGKIALWQNKADEHKEKQLINPFSEWEGASHRAKLSKDDKEYATPVPGSFTEKRGREASNHISNEIIQLCHVIAEHGTRQADGTYVVTFGELFEAYTRISNKLVGMLMRARKQKLLTFEGEMLFQRRDDDVKITVFTVPDWN
ncbi:actin-binding Rho-activating protein-like [Gigantopelta aegis]|uniref:actin-binding Rho-activating protein-like n=1 Tax=Gigantopelta aegis TaxID=1735272 RepID=UPI001B887F6C|nr:actin-binding Rho-activating protein-like [Gigantopelta aegis]